MTDEPSEIKPVWNYTMSVRQYANESPYGSAGGGPYGSYKNRHIIGRDSRILGGISMVAGHPILIVVSEEDGGLSRVYTRLTNRISARDVRRVADVLKVVHDLVRETLPYTNGLSKRVAREKSVRGKETELPLSYFVELHEGACWHQGLLAAYLIERLIDDKVFSGKISTDRNMKRDVLREWVEFGTGNFVGHQWARYTAVDGTVRIVDPAQDYCGLLSEVPLDRRGHWKDYFRPGDPIPKPPVPPVPLLEPFDYAVLATSPLVASGLWLWYHFS